MRNAMSVSKLKYATLKNSSGLYNWSATHRNESRQQAEDTETTHPRRPETDTSSTVNPPPRPKEQA
ncbi:hypothetical protein [Vampirovibrio chlorellavorus]|uniref:hypothetical protein n=1 Tax=Vampirovibrio chlorellavorus TaxID=758823 RepID=UPI0026E93AD0|nr:hypothetical protein [Vampirovibrio chlorellavorus]